jgi:hypothetical protein
MRNSLVKDYVSQGRENVILVIDSLGIITTNHQCTLTGKSPTVSALPVNSSLPGPAVCSGHPPPLIGGSVTPLGKLQ